MKKSFVQATVGLLVLMLSLTVPWLFRSQFQINPFAAELPYEYPSFAAVDSQGNTYLIDRSQKRIVKTSPHGDLAWAIDGGSRDPGSFYFADELSVDTAGNVYVLNRVPDAPGFYTVTTQVLRFRADGSFDVVVAEKSYPEDQRIPTLVQRGQWHSLQVQKTGVAWFDSTPQGLMLYSGTPGSIKTSLAAGPLAADLLIPSAGLTPDGNVVYVTKQGRILEAAPGQEPRVIWDASLASTGSTPWKLRVTPQGRIFFTDLSRLGVGEVLPDQTAPLWFTGEALVYSVSTNELGGLGISGDAGVQFIGTDGKVQAPPAAARFSAGAMAVHFGLWALLFLAVVDLFFLGWVVYVHGFQRTIPQFFKTVVGVVFLTAVVGGFVSFMILNNFSQRYSAEVLDKLTQLVHLVPQVIPTDKFLSVREPGQFAGPEYSELRNRIIGVVYGDQGKDNQGLYFALHRMSEGHLTTFMYLNGDTTIRHPFSYLEDPEGPYQKAMRGETVSERSLDAWGSWMYATSPIKSADGTIVGVFEMGGDLYSFTQENNRLIQSLLINILTVVIVFLLILVESTFLQDLLRKRTADNLLREQGVEPRREQERFRPSFLVRPLTGVFFVAASLSLLFLPLMTKQLYHPLAGLPENVVYGLPLSLRLFFFGLGTVIAGNLCSRWGWRPVFLAGVALLAIGLGAAALAPDLLWFLVSSLPIGLGTGLGMIALRSLIHSEGTEGDESRAYSHFYAGIIAGTNVGVIVGSALADSVGFANVFWVAVVVTLAAGWMALRLFPKPTPYRESGGNLSTFRALGLFFSNPSILRFSVFVVLPVYVASMVLYFFFPIFASEQGLSNADMGRVFLLNGLIIVYLGPSLSRLVQTTFGVRGGVIISSLLWVLALVPFIIWGDLFGLILTIGLMAVAEATAVVAHNEHLLALPVSRTLGSDRAVGNFEVVAKVGETVAPVLIGFAMLLGARWGIALVVGALALGLILFSLFGRQEKSGVEE